MHKPYVYYRLIDKTRGTIVAISPRELAEHDVPLESAKFAISKAEFSMFQKGLVAIANWQVLFDPKTKSCQLVKRHDAARYENANILLEVRDSVDPDVQIEFRDGSFMVMPGPSWVPVEKNSLPMDFYLTRRGDPNILLAQTRIDPKDLTKPIELFTTLPRKPKWGKFSILVPGGFQHGLRYAAN